MFSYFWPQTAYSPENEDQQEQVKRQIDAVKKAFNELFAVDSKVCMPLGMTSICWVFGYVGNVLCTAANLGFYFFISQSCDRAGKANIFQEELAKLLQVYRWCGEKGPEVSYDETFLQVLEVLAPFVRTENLCLWESQVSKRYREILAAPPHNQVFKEYRQMELNQGFFSNKFFSNTMLAPVVSYVPDLKPAERWLFRVSAETKFFLYGMQNEKEEKWAPSKS